MFWLRRAASCDLLLLVLTVQSQSDGSFDLRSVYVSSEELLIECSVSGAVPGQHVIHLLCPLSTNELCYSNCSDIGSLYPIILRCSYTMSAESRMTVTYAVNPTKLTKDGDWYCTYRGSKSQPVKLLQSAFSSSSSSSTKASTTTATTTSAATISTTKSKKSATDSNNKINEPSVTPDKNRGDPSGDVNYQTKREWTPISKPEMVLVLLAVLLFSILINVAFCIRCILVKTYLDSTRNGEPSRRCLERCLCLGPDPRRQFWKMFHRRRFGSKGKHEGIYEDLSETIQRPFQQQGFVKRPSLQSQLNDAAMLMPIPGQMYPAYGNPMPVLYYTGGTYPRNFHGTPSMCPSNMTGVCELPEREIHSVMSTPMYAHNHQVVYDDVPIMEMHNSVSAGALYGAMNSHDPHRQMPYASSSHHNDSQSSLLYQQQAAAAHGISPMEASGVLMNGNHRDMHHHYQPDAETMSSSNGGDYSKTHSASPTPMQQEMMNFIHHNDSPSPTTDVQSHLSSS